MHDPSGLDGTLLIQSRCHSMLERPISSVDPTTWGISGQSSWKVLKMKKIAIGIVVLLAVAACAQQPASIVPVSMGDAYANVSCSKAKQLYLKESAKVPTLIAAQKQAVSGDAMGVFLLGVPVSSLSGADVEGEIAATKGKLLALGARLEACGTSPAEVAWGN